MEDIFDNLITYDEVMRWGNLIKEKENEKHKAQQWEYKGRYFAMLWDKETGRNLKFEEYE